MLSFTDAQIKILTQDMVDYPANISRLNTNLTEITAIQAGMLLRDQSNGVYTTNFADIITSYHDELKYISGVSRAAYDPTNVTQSGQLIPGNLHFPPSYINFQPRLDSTNKGLPTSAWANTEDAAIVSAQTWIDILKNGWSDGAASTTTTSGFSTATIGVVSTAGFAVGNRVLFVYNNDFLYGTISGITGTNLIISSLISSSGFGGILTGATLVNFFAGWSSANRDAGTGGSTALSAFMASIKSQIDTAVATWETRLLAVQSALAANTAIGTEATQIAAAAVVVQGHLNVVNAWQAHPSIGVGTSRFGTNLPALETDFTTRQGEFAGRSAQISSGLGTLTQAGDGSYSGSGQYFNLFDNLNVRLNKITGSLRVYYDMNRSISSINEEIDLVDNQQTRDSVTFTVTLFTANAPGFKKIAVASVSGLAINDFVKVMSSDQAVMDVQVTDIVGLVLTLDTDIPTDYKVSKSARVVKQN